MTKMWLLVSFIDSETGTVHHGQELGVVNNLTRILGQADPGNRFFRALIPFAGDRNNSLVVFSLQDRREIARLPVGAYYRPTPGFAQCTIKASLDGERLFIVINPATI